MNFDLITEYLKAKPTISLNLQRSVQATIDLAAWVCNEKKWGIPDSIVEI